MQRTPATELASSSSSSRSLRTDVRNTQIFGGDTSKSGAGVLKQGMFVGTQTTYTRPARTVFVTNIPHEISINDVEKVFKNDPGFERLRTVRHGNTRLVFVDFEDIKVRA